MLSLENLKKNWKSGLTVALINIPLSISLALASGATPTQGLITAIWGGIIAAIFASSNYNIYGVAGALSSILLAFVLSQGPQGFLFLPFIAILSGIFILIIYYLRITKYIILIPSNTLHGFIISVGIIIFLSQLFPALGLNNPALGIEIQKEVYLNMMTLFQHINDIHLVSVVVFLSGLLFLLLTKRIFPNFPGVIFLAIGGIVFGFLSSYGYVPKVLLLSDVFPNLTFQVFQIPFFHVDISSLKDVFLLLKTIFITALVVAIISVLETLISAKAASKIKKEKFDKNKEVFGLGMSNLGSGILGGLPTTAVFIRTALNIKSGATHKTSAFMFGVFTFLIGALFFNDFFKYLPYPIIAAILVNISLGLIDLQLIKKIYQIDKTSFFILLITAFFAIVEDPIFGILIGTSISLIIFIKNVTNSNASVTVYREQQFFAKMKLTQYIGNQKENDIVLMKFVSGLNYLNIENNIEKVEALNKKQVIIISFAHIGDIDMDGLEALEEMTEKLQTKEISVYFSGVSDFMKHQLSNFSFFQHLEKQNKVIASTSDLMRELLNK